MDEMNDSMERRLQQATEAVKQLSCEEILTFLPSDIKNDGRSFAFVGGSAAEGLADKESDIDIYVITDDRPPIDGQLRKRHNWVLGEGDDWYAEDGAALGATFDYLDDVGSGLEVEYHRSRYIDQQIELISTDYLQASQLYDASPYTHYTNDVDLIRRVLTGIPILNSQAFLDCRARINQGQLNFVTYKRLTLGWEYFKNLRGAWRSGDLRSCLGLAEKLASASLLASLSLGGQIVLNERWLPRILIKWELQPRMRAALEAYFEAREKENETDDRRRATIFRLMEIIDELHAIDRQHLDAREQAPRTAELAALADKEFERCFLGHKQQLIEVTWWKNRLLNQAEPTASFL